MNNRTAIQRLKTRLVVHVPELPIGAVGANLYIGKFPIVIDDSWLNSPPVLIVPTEEGEKHTAHMPAFTKLLHERKEETLK